MPQRHYFRYFGQSEVCITSGPLFLIIGLSEVCTTSGPLFLMIGLSEIRATRSKLCRPLFLVINLLLTLLATFTKIPEGVVVDFLKILFCLNSRRRLVGALKLHRGFIRTRKQILTPQKFYI